MANGTVVNVEKTVVPHNIRTVAYDWTIAKSVVPTSATLNLNDSVDLDYTVSATRSEPTITDNVYVSGIITVENTGQEATQNLTITDRVETNKAGSGWTPIATVSIDPGRELAAGETRNYPYTVSFTPVTGSGVQYRNVADVSITNRVGQPGEVSHILDRVNFNLPTQTIETIDESATVTEVETCPAGYSCQIVSGSPPDGSTISGNITYAFTKRVTRVNGAEAVSYLTNTATVTPTDTPDNASSASAQVVLQAGQQQGPVLTASKTAVGTSTTTNTYAWSIEKSVDPTSLTLNSGQSADLHYSILVSRNLVSTTTSGTVSGDVTVTNSGGEAATGLTIFDEVRHGESIVASGEVVSGDTLAAGATRSYSYSFNIDNLTLGDVYENVASITISNGASPPNATATFTFTNTVVNVDDTASVTDAADPCPTGYTCSVSSVEQPPNNTSVSDTTPFTFTKTVTRTNGAAPVSYLNNTATVTTPSGAGSSSAAQVVLQAGQQQGPVLAATKTATGVRTITRTYVWTIDKSVTPDEITLGPGQSATLHYNIAATRTLTETTFSARAFGDVTVTNSGTQAAAGLTIVDEVKLGGAVVASATLVSGGTLGVGETKGYHYDLDIPNPDPTATYENVATVTISNGTAPPSPVVSFTLTDEEVTVGETATITDVEVCPPGFSCVPSGTMTFSANETTVFPFEKTVTNISATPGTTAFLTDTATVVPSEGAPDSDSESVTIHVPGRRPQNRGYNIPEITPLG